MHLFIGGQDQNCDW